MARELNTRNFNKKVKQERLGITEEEEMGTDGKKKGSQRNEKRKIKWDDFPFKCFNSSEVGRRSTQLDVVFEAPLCVGE